MCVRKRHGAARADITAEAGRRSGEASRLGGGRASTVPTRPAPEETASQDSLQREGTRGRWSATQSRGDTRERAGRQRAAHHSDQPIGIRAFKPTPSPGYGLGGGIVCCFGCSGWIKVLFTPQAPHRATTRGCPTSPGLPHSATQCSACCTATTGAT